MSFLLLACAAAAPAHVLPPQVEAALARARLPPDAMTMLVAPADGSGPPRLSYRADMPVNPASIGKLATTIAALDLLGPAYTWHTPVYLGGPIRDGTLQGDLYIKGSGDPKLLAEQLWLLLRRVQGLGIRSIAGDIVLDRSAFDVGPSDPGAFDGEPLRPYNAAPDALLVNFKSLVLTFTPVAGQVRVHAEPPLADFQVPALVPAAAGPCTDWRSGLRADFADPSRIRFAGAYPLACGEQVWPLAAADPAGFAARAIAGTWRSIGGTLSGRVRDGVVPPGLAPALEWTSPPLADIVRSMNKFSNNLMARQVFLTLSLQAQGIGTPAGSRALLRQWWQRRIGAPGVPTFTNGAGLSRDERVTARQLTALLQFAWRSALMPEVVSSLPLVGVDGTLQRVRTGVGMAHLKDGSLRDVAGVAGIVEGASGRRYVMVAIANDPDAAAARPAIAALLDWTIEDR